MTKIQNHFCYVPENFASDESNEETSDKLKLRFMPQNTLQKCQCHESQGKMEDCFTLKEIKDT